MTFAPETGLIDLAIRQVVDCISYSNALPPWNETIKLEYDTRRNQIAQKLQEIVSGSPIETPFTINVPANGNRQRLWSILSVNDQIALHYVTLWISRRMLQVTNPKVVHSYLNSTDNNIAFVENQMHSWGRFQAATTDRGKQKYMLQLDLKSTFKSISKIKFVEFFESHVGNTPETTILSAFLDMNGEVGTGVPLVNDSLFYLGNLYLSVVDDVVSRHCSDFIRFVDDYRLFFNSKSELEHAFSVLSKAIKDAGFEINEGKTRAGTVDDYIQATSARTIKPTKGDGQYINPVLFSDTVDPKSFYELLSKAIDNYDRYVTEGYGRLMIALVRKRIFTSKVHQEMTCIPSEEEMNSTLDDNLVLMDKMISLLNTLLKRNDQTWRVLWLLFMMAEIPGQRLRNIAEKIVHDPKLPLVIRLRASKMISDHEPSSQEIELLHSMGYLEEGHATTKTKL